jgi:hypothetical protein
VVALRSLQAEDVRADWLAEQQSYVRRNLCVRCGHSKPLCACGEYEDWDDRREYGTDEQEPA